MSYTAENPYNDHENRVFYQWIHSGDHLAAAQLVNDLAALDEWVAELSPANTCVAPVYSMDELVEDPQFLARGIFGEVEHPEHGRFRQVNPALAGMRRPTEPVPVPDWSKTDTADLLAEAGVQLEEIEAMRDEGIVA